jgi:hypothetical protein
MSATPVVWVVEQEEKGSALHQVLLERKIAQKQPNQEQDLVEVLLGHIVKARTQRPARAPKTSVRTLAGHKQITQTLDRALQTRQGRMLHQRESERSSRKPLQ